MAAQSLSTVAILVVTLLTLHGATAFNMASDSRQTATSLGAVSRREALAASASAAMLAGIPMDALGESPPKLEPDKKKPPPSSTSMESFVIRNIRRATASSPGPSIRQLP